MQQQQQIKQASKLDAANIATITIDVDLTELVVNGVWLDIFVAESHCWSKFAFESDFQNYESALSSLHEEPRALDLQHVI